MNTTHWDFLQDGDTIDIIAPSSPPGDPLKTIKAVQDYFSENTKLKLHIPSDMIEPTIPLNEANTIKKRVEFIKQALESDSKAIWAILGGGWGCELLGSLKKTLDISKAKFKPIIGYSDVTALHVFFNNYWKRPTLHGVVLGANGDINSDTSFNKTHIENMLNVLYGKESELNYTFEVLNYNKVQFDTINTSIVGGNSLVINSLNGARSFNFETKGKTLFIESIAINPGMLSRILNGLLYSDAVQNANAIIIGNFVEHGGKPNPALIEERYEYLRVFFANRINVPVLFSKNFGHGPVNFAFPLHTLATIKNSGNEQASLTISANQNCTN